MSKYTDKLSDREKFIVWLSMLGGLGFGLMGNMIVTATFRYMDNMNSTNALTIYVITWIAFLIIFSIITKSLDKLYKKL